VYLFDQEPNIETLSNGDDWYTPPWLLAWLPPIALDPCACHLSPVDAVEKIDVRSGRNGLAESWNVSSEGIVFVNPPFSDTARWLAKCRQEGKVRVVVALVPAIPGDGPWHDQVWGRVGWVGFIRHRVAFTAPDGHSETKGRGHALLVYGPKTQANETKNVIAANARRHPQRPWWVPGNWNLTGE
jgi:hypothetical protein